MVKKFSQLYLDARRALMAQEDQQTASLLARSLLCFVSGKTQEQVIADREKYACEQVCLDMESSVQRLLEGEPLAYVLGEWSFYGMTLYVDKNVLIPRDDTCAVTQLAIKRGLFLEQDPRVLDLCTGSGCIGLAIANGIVAFAGALLAQYKGSASINDGRGAIVIGLAAIFIGLSVSLKIKPNFVVSLIGVIGGGIVYYIVYNFVILMGLMHGLVIGTVAAVLECIMLVIRYSAIGISGLLLFYNADISNSDNNTPISEPRHRRFADCITQIMAFN